MADAMRAMLDGLMGTDRDMTDGEKEKNRRTFDSPEVDVTYLCGCSPWHLLSETSSEKMLPRGGWNKVHDDFLRRQWVELPQEEKDKYGFEYETMKVLEDLVGQIDRRIFLNKKKIEDECGLPPEHQHKVDEIDAAIKQLQEKADELGEQGDVDSSMSCINEAAQLKETKDQIIEEHRPKTRRSIVCEVTGARISETDMHRLTDGKMYRGWQLMRRELKNYQEREGGPPKPKPRPSYREREREREDRDRDRRRDDRGGDRGRDRYGDRDRYGGGRSSRYDRSRSRDRRRRSRSRSRSGDRRRRSRSNDRRR